VNTASSKADLPGCHSDLDSSRIDVLPNGYEESDFDGITVACRNAPDRCLVLLHSGEIYLVALHQAGALKSNRVSSTKYEAATTHNPAG
jgi:hypothetical protein